MYVCQIFSSACHYIDMVMNWLIKAKFMNPDFGRYFMYTSHLPSGEQAYQYLIDLN